MSLDSLLNVFRAIGEETRLRIAALLLHGELTVSELTQILGQSQPRVSRHLKIMADAGLVERHREGSWIFYRAASANGSASASAVELMVADLAESSDRVVARDRERLDQVRAARAAAAAAYFKDNASDWDRVRGLHIAEAVIEDRMRAMLKGASADVFVDLGTGTGRMLSVFADCYRSGIGFDLSREMLAVARANLDAAGIDHAQVRLADILSLPLQSDSADIVCIHQVLHFLAEPESAVREAARVLKSGGELIVSDFAPHGFEFLREAHAHRRLGFSDKEVGQWFAAAGLELCRTESLTPEDGRGEALTVKIWRGRRAAETIALRDGGDVLSAIS